MTKEKLKLIFKIVLSICLLLYLVYKIDTGHFFSILKTLNWVLVLGMYFYCIPGTLISSYKWRVLLNVQQVFERQTFLWRLYFISIFYSNFLPTSVGGDVVRSYIVGKKHGKQRKVFIATLIERITGFSMLVAIGLAGLILNRELAIKLHLHNLLLLSALSVVIFSSALFSKKIRLLIRNNFFPRLFDKLEEKLSYIKEAVLIYGQQPGPIIFAIFISLFFQLLHILFVFLLARIIGLDVAYTTLLLIWPAIDIIGLFPFSLNGLGIREGAFIFFFNTLGHSNEIALTLAVLYRVGGSFVPGIVGGIMNLIRTSKSNNDSSFQMNIGT